MRGLLLLMVWMIPLISLQAQSGNGAKGILPVTSGSEGAFNSQDIRVFPNPVLQKRFTVETAGRTILEIRISNIAGIMVYDKKFMIPVSRFEAIIDQIPSGIYLLRISCDNHTSKTIKLLISSPR